jgi:hypothetical protein
MVSGSQISSIVFRVWELICACVVVGLIGTYLSYLGNAHVTSARMDYVIATASLSIIGSLALAPPLRYSFYACPFDLAMFIMWMVAFGLMIDVSSIPNTALIRAGRLDTNNYHSLLEQPVATQYGTGTIGATTGAAITPTRQSHPRPLLGPQDARSGELSWHLLLWEAGPGLLACVL